MILKIIKILLLSSKSYLLFIFIATFLSLFSYILSSNVVLSVEEYLQSQIKPLLWGDIVITARSDIIWEDFYNAYSQNLLVAETIETSTTLFDNDKQPSLVELTFIGENYPVYDEFIYDEISASWSIIVSNDVFEKFWSTIELYDTDYAVKWVLQTSTLWSLSVFSNTYSIYLPYSEFEDSWLTPETARINYVNYLEFKGEYDSDIVSQIKTDSSLQDSRIRSLDDRNENIWEITDRFKLFLNIFNLIVFVLTFFIIIISLEIFYKNLKSTIGLLSILWLKKNKIFLISITSLAGIYIVALWLSIAANMYAIDFLKQEYDFFRIHSVSYFQWVSISLVLLFIWVSSPFYKISKSSIGSLLSDREVFSRFRFTDYLVYLWLIFSGFFLISFISGETLFSSLIYSVICIVSILTIYISTRFILLWIYALIRSSIWSKKYFYLYDAFRSTVRPGNVSFFIILSSFISFLSIFVFYVFSGSFLNFLDDLTNNSNDTFVVNITAEDIDVTREYFESDNIFEISGIRIREINGFTLEDYKNLNEIRWWYTREYFLSTWQVDDPLAEWETLEEWWISIGQEFAQGLKLRLWDDLVVSIAGIDRTLRVQNFREIQRNGTDPFFLFQAKQGDFEWLPKRYFVSYDSRAYPEDIQFEYSQNLSKSVSFINTREIIDIVLDVAEKILLVVYFCLIYIGIFSFITFLVSVSFLKTFKTHKLKLLHILWWKKHYLHRWVLIEYGYLIALWIIISILISTIALLVLAYFIDFFEIDLWSYIRGLILLGTLFLFMLGYLRLSKNKI